MPHLTFTLNPDMSDADRTRMLSAVAAIDGVTAVSMIDPDSPVPEIRNLGVIRLKPDAGVAMVLTKLKPFDLDVSPGADRKLISPRRAGTGARNKKS